MKLILPRLALIAMKDEWKPSRKDQTPNLTETTRLQCMDFYAAKANIAQETVVLSIGIGTEMMSPQ